MSAPCVSAVSDLDPPMCPALDCAERENSSHGVKHAELKQGEGLKVVRLMMVVTLSLFELRGETHRGGRQLSQHGWSRHNQ